MLRVEVLEEYRPELSREVANFLKDLVVKCFTTQRSAYDSVDLDEVYSGIGPKCRMLCNYTWPCMSYLDNT